MGNQNILTLGLQAIQHNICENISSEKTIIDFSKSKQLQLIFPCYLVHKNNQLQIITNQQQEQINQEDFLYKFQMESYSGLICTKMNDKIQNKFWKVVTDKQNQLVKGGDQIKLANIQFELSCVIDTSGNVSSYSERIQHSLQSIFQSNQSNLTESQMNRCRICFEVTNTDKNPLISLCNCQGSVKYTHYQCLKKWQQSKIKQTDFLNYLKYQVGLINCDLCKKNLPPLFIHDKKILTLFSNCQQGQACLLLQQKNTSKNKKIYYKVKLFDGISLELGRDTECGLVINSNSISRKHCLLFYMHKKVFLRDLGSKYGTFHHSNLPLYNFNPQKGIQLLLQNTLLKLSLYRNSWKNLQLPKICCSANLNINLRIFNNQDDAKKTLETSPGFFDFVDFDMLEQI